MTLSPLPLRTSKHVQLLCYVLIRKPRDLNANIRLQFVMVSARSDIRIFHCSWQPERQVPFEDVRLPPPADTKNEIREGEEVEVRKARPFFFFF